MNKAAKNNDGMEIREVFDPSGGCFLEVWKTNSMGRKTSLLVSCIVANGETHSQAVAGLLSEFKNPFGAYWETPEQYETEFDAVRFLANFYGIETEGGCK